MSTFSYTRHVEARMRQRGLRDADLALVMEVASPVGDDAWLLTDADADDEIVRLKHRLQRVERLRGTKVVLLGDAVITAYRSKPADQKRALRKGREAR
ncbi:hypothetical protein P2H44_11345 [Albimonas sp. CAU 1670]|uniref:hypothetical protein n=1 Tax=Albimonas sp. CAU 1670 TaxID=3032599 RepID=UPI0023D9DD84|nr:hypothetical protein [Albimonas sp. CAU 1670]MDF2233146.1 hypothetical protein [Albimonas sp. CAU 1670]